MFGKVKTWSRGVVAAVAGLAVSASVALADSTDSTGIDLSELEPDYSSLGPIALAIGGGLMAMWGIRKVIKLVNRS